MHSNCQYVVFSDRAYNAIINESFKLHPNETGGILLGHILDNGCWIVMEVLPPGWNSVFQYAYFEYDERFVNYLAQSVATEYEQELSLLGLWHRHPGDNDIFSHTDNDTNRTFAELNIHGAISGLVNIDPTFRLTMFHVSHPLHYNKVEIEVGDSLIPVDYFKLKHYPEKGLNPMPPTHREITEGVLPNEQNGITLEINDNIQKSKIIGSKILSFLDSKYVFFLISLISLVITLFSQHLYNTAKGSAEGIKALYHVLYAKPGLDTFPVPYSVASFKVHFFIDCVWFFTLLSLLVALFVRYRKTLFAFAKDIKTLIP